MAVSTKWSDRGVRWFAYAEPHRLTDPGRRRDGSAARLDRGPDAVVHSPDEVAAWLSRQRAELAKRADADGRRLNALVADTSGVNAGTAAAGRSTYASVRLTFTDVVDLCVEAVEVGPPVNADGCASPRGHNYQRNSRGDRRCVNCGQAM